MSCFIPADAIKGLTAFNQKPYYLPIMSPRGGARPGAGAPAGNLNRLTHGRRSKKFDKMIERVLADPQGRADLISLIQRYSNPEVSTKEASES